MRYDLIKNSSFQHQKSAGFTLIEVLIAISITVVVAAIAYQSLDSAMRLAESSQEQIERTQRLNRAMAILAEDFRHGITRTVRSPLGVGQESAMDYAQTNYPMLVLSRGGKINPNPQYFQRSSLQRIAYHVEDGKLERWQWSAIDAYSDPEPQKIEVLDNVVSMELRFFAISATTTGGTLANRGQWQNQWPSSTGAYSGAATDIMPAAIEVTLELKSGGKIRRIFELPGS